MSTEGEITRLDRRTVLKAVGAGAIATGLGGVTAQPDAEASPTVRGSVEQVMVTRVVPGATVRLYDGDGAVVETADARYPEEPEPWFESASYVFREVEPGDGYRVSQVVDGEESPRSEPVEVLSPEFVPPQEFYDQQTIEPTPEGEIGYIETRDGTTLAHQTVHPSAEVAGPPYPTLVLYDGYAPSVNLPGEEIIIDFLVEEMGYAIVAVNMRGTQCSGGKFDFFERLQILDGYDMIEAVGAQAWSDGIGMAGGSYGGYSQFYVGAAQPPSLDALAPGMPVGDFFRDVGRPGGMLNQTFGAAWAGSRDQAARHDQDGRGDSTERVLNDDTCLENQLLRPNNEPTLGRLERFEHMTEFYRERSPWTLVEDIEVPLLLNVAWQDEQVGSRSARLQERFGDIPVRFVAGNGGHDIYTAPAVVDELVRFFGYHVEGEIPEPDTDEFDRFDAAFAAYEREDPVTILWEMDGDLTPRARSNYAEWPPGETWELYAQPDGRLDTDPPSGDGPEASGYEFVSEGFLFQTIERDEGKLQWERDDESEYVAFVTDELAEDRVCIGSGLVELWLRSSAENTDLQVTLSEVRPDGQEMFVQNGWLRASRRAEDDSLARPRRPWHTHATEDEQPLPDEFERMRVELFPFGHVFREGSRVKIAVDNPGGTRDLWGFDVLEAEATNEVAHTPEMPTKLELPLVDEPAPTDGLPPCDGVRNQPCRPVDLDSILGSGDDSGVDDPEDGDDTTDDDGQASDDDPEDGDDTTDGGDDGQASDDDTDTGDSGDDEDGSGPGFTLPAGIASVGGAAYLLGRRLTGEGERVSASEGESERSQR